MDCLIESALGIKAVEIKSSTTLHPEFFKGLNYYKEFSGLNERSLYLIYGGNKNIKRKEASVFSWKNTSDLI